MGRNGRGLGTSAWLGAMALLLALSGCSAPPRTPEPSALPPLDLQLGTPGQWTGILPSTDLAVGQDQRFLIAFIDPDNKLITDAQVQLSFFQVLRAGPQLRFRAEPTFREPPGLPDRGVYVARVDFDDAGRWLVVAVIDRPGTEPPELQLRFQVKDRSSTPAVGEKVPASRTPTGRTREEIERFSSARPPDPALYRVSIADALNQGKPLVVLFATPGFCSSRVCGPSLQVLQELRQRFGDEANFIHVEIYKDGRPPVLVPTVPEWGLTSEPWVFLVGRDGRLADKFEGGVTAEEVAPVLASLLGRSSPE